MQPLSSHVLVKKHVPEKTTKTGIILTNTDDPTTNVLQGTVVAVGPGRIENGVLVPMTVKVGDTVLFNKFAQYPTINHEGCQHFLILEQGLLAVV